MHDLTSQMPLLHDTSLIADMVLHAGVSGSRLSAAPAARRREYCP